jgi:hypothetical protein
LAVEVAPFDPAMFVPEGATVSRTSASEVVGELSPVLAATNAPAVTAPSTSVAVLTVENVTVPAPDGAALLVDTLWLAPSVSVSLAVSVASDVAETVARS